MLSPTWPSKAVVFVYIVFVRPVSGNCRFTGFCFGGLNISRRMTHVVRSQITVDLLHRGQCHGQSDAQFLSHTRSYAQKTSMSTARNHILTPTSDGCILDPV